jgi:hypothetical protein
MSIRMVAVELYRVLKEMEGLEKKLESQEAGPEQRAKIGEKLRKARAVKVRLEKMIEGAKGD